MDEDLKIILTSELEADEQASAQRISAQLPSIAKLINSKSTIKVGVSLDDATLQTQTQKLSSQLQSFSARSKFSMKLDFGSDKVDEMVRKLHDLKIPDSAIKDFVAGIDKGIVGISQIRTGFSDVGDSAKTITATVEGITAAGERLRQTISQSFILNEDTQEWIEGVRRSTTSTVQNYEQLAQAEEKAAAAAKKIVQDNTADIIKWEHSLESVRNSWDGINKTVAQDGHISELQTEYERIIKMIRSLNVEGERFGSDISAAIVTQISKLKELASAYAKLEKAPTELRAKDVSVIKEDQIYRLQTFETRMANSGVLTDELREKISALRSELNGVVDANGITQFMDKFSVLKSQGESLREEMRSIRFSEELEQSAQRISDTMDITRLRVEQLRQKYSQLSQPTAEVTARMKEMETLVRAVDNAKSAEERIEAYQRLETAINDCNKSLTLQNQIQSFDVKDSALEDKIAKAKADLETIKRTWSALFGDTHLKGVFNDLSKGIDKVNNQADFTAWQAYFNRFKSEVKAAGRNMMSFGDVIKENIGKVAQWALATMSIYDAIRLLKNGVQIIVDLDTAMIDLRKTTEATEEQYRSFYTSASETAKRLGVTTAEVISQTAEWSRLGYTMQEAAKLAENSAVFRAISPEMDISVATDGLVSVIKAFDIDVEDAMNGIIDKVNAVGNAFAVSNSDIVEALTRSSSAMAAANNTFDETVALATAAIEITRDAASVGNGLKTLSMRIRGYDEETEEFTGGVEELTGTIADLTKTASNIRGVSLFESGDPDTYRSTYDILKDIADIWDEITDKNQAQLLEALFGKRQAQIGSAILSNFSQAEETIKTMAESAGSAEAEMENIYQSLEYKLNQFSQTWVGVTQNILNTDVVKGIVDLINGISGAIEKLTSVTGTFGAVSIVTLIAGLVKLYKTVGRPKMTGFIMIVPTYALVVTRNELAV